MGYALAHWRSDDHVRLAVFLVLFAAAANLKGEFQESKEPSRPLLLCAAWLNNVVICGTRDCVRAGRNHSVYFLSNRTDQRSSRYALT